ncbi:hypothetical protein M153_10624000732 [Pseudoloma neurophilia]|uniref:FAR-17a/AIG1-like protein n=1 Tax=Pseudoloma neurophilia TaxID=146866 RepID=A0A0R0LZL0_9MICR|nr:hypothetical protein M153_10624000732 [Pseudoloma neurophilia]
MEKRYLIRILRCSILFSSALILLAARIYPLFDYDYIEYVRITNRIPLAYLTNICAVESILLFTFGAINLILKSFIKDNHIINMSVWIYYKLISDLLSLNITMSFGYWYLMFYDPDLVAGTNKDVDFKGNAFFSFADHTLPPIVNLIEAYFVRARFTISSIIVGLKMGVAYFTHIAIVHHLKGQWPYKLFNGKSYPMVFVYVIIYLAIGTFGAFLCLYLFKKIQKSQTDQNPHRNM